MRRKEPTATPLDELPDWVLNAHLDAPNLPPVPPMDPAFGFPEAMWVRITNGAASAQARRDWMAEHGVSSRDLWQRRRQITTTEGTAR